MTRLKHRAARTSVLILAALILAPSLWAAPSDPAPTTAFSQVLASYETARLALTEDLNEGVAEQGREILNILQELAADWSTEAAGIRPVMADDVRALLPELTRAAAALAAADDLDASRDAFYALSKPLVRWRKAAVGERPVVVYCPMSRRSWLQDEGELGNPYHGQAMPHCGEVVDG